MEGVEMKLIRISVAIVLVMLLTVLTIGDSSATRAKATFYELLAGSAGAWLGGRFGGLAVYIIGRPFSQWEEGDGVGNRSLPFLGIGTHGGMMAGSIGGVYLASDREGSLFWTAVGSSIPMLISIACVAIKGEDVFQLLQWRHISGDQGLFGYFGVMYRGFAGTLLSPVGAVVGYELSRSEESQQRNGQSSQNEAPAFYVPLLMARF
jgi:hypothetical protein